VRLPIHAVRAAAAAAITHWWAVADQNAIPAKASVIRLNNAAIGMRAMLLRSG